MSQAPYKGPRLVDEGHGVYSTEHQHPIHGTLRWLSHNIDWDAGLWKVREHPGPATHEDAHTTRLEIEFCDREEAAEAAREASK